MVVAGGSVEHGVKVNSKGNARKRSQRDVNGEMLLVRTTHVIHIDDLRYGLSTGELLKTKYNKSRGKEHPVLL